MWLQPLGIDMKANSQTRGTGGTVTAETRKFVVAVGLLGGAFAMLVAASYPGITAAFATGALSALLVGRVAGYAASTEGVCVPGTDICLRTTF